MVVSEVDMLEAEVVMVEIFHKDNEEATGIATGMVAGMALLETFHKEAEEVITMAILARLEDLMVVFQIAKVF